MTEPAVPGRVFDGVLNFRDVGGLPAGGNGRTRSGVLFRSDAFLDASEQDVDYVTRVLGVRRVVDLRATRETEMDPDSPFARAGLDRRFRPVDRGPGNAIEGAAEGERLAHRYLEYLVDSRDSFVGAVRDLADPDNPPTLVHCRIGKDRTGVAIAVLLALAGVPAEAIADDYAITATAMPRILEVLAASDVYRENVSKLPPEMYSANAQTMELFLALVDERFGSMEQWARAQGVTDDEIGQLRQNLTVASAQ